MEMERIMFDYHLNSISQEEARDEIWRLFLPNPSTLYRGDKVNKDGLS